MEKINFHKTSNMVIAIQEQFCNHCNKVFYELEGQELEKCPLCEGDFSELEPSQNVCDYDTYSIVLDPKTGVPRIIKEGEYEPITSNHVLPPLHQLEITAARYVNEVEPSNTPGEPFRQRDHYSNIILDIYAVLDVSCDSSDRADLNDKFRNNQFNILENIESEKYWGYTHLIQDDEKKLFIVTFKKIQ